MSEKKKILRLNKMSLFKNFLISKKEALSVCLGSAELSIEAPRRVEEQRCNRIRAPPPPVAGESDERVVELTR